MRDGRVDPAGDEHGVDEVGQELAPLGYRPGHYGGGRGSEHELIRKKYLLFIFYWLVWDH